MTSAVSRAAILTLYTLRVLHSADDDSDGFYRNFPRKSRGRPLPHPPQKPFGSQNSKLIRQSLHSDRRLHSFILYHLIQQDEAQTRKRGPRVVANAIVFQAKSVLRVIVARSVTMPDLPCHQPRIESGSESGNAGPQRRNR